MKITKDMKRHVNKTEDRSISVRQSDPQIAEMIQRLCSGPFYSLGKHW